MEKNEGEGEGKRGDVDPEDLPVTRREWETWKRELEERAREREEREKPEEPAEEPEKGAAKEADEWD